MPQAQIYLPNLPEFRHPVDDALASLWRGCVSEFFATLIFVFVGTGSVIAAKTNLSHVDVAVKLQIASLVLISLAHGFAIMVLVYAIGEVSGGHINPAVTWAALLTNKISVIRALCYIIAQLCGAVAGSGILSSLVPPVLQFKLGCHGINPGITPAQGFGAEVMFTFIFIFVVFATAISPFAGKLAPLSGGGSEYGPGKLTPFAVGMTILILHTVGIPLTGASMNPARSFGPAIIKGTCWDNHWIYWAGPFVGSSAAALIAQVIFLNSPETIAHIFRVAHHEEHDQVHSQATEEKPHQPVQTNAAPVNTIPLSKVSVTKGSDSGQSYAMMKEEEVQLEENI